MEYTCTTAPVQFPAYLHFTQVRIGPHPLRRSGFWLAMAGLDTVLDTMGWGGHF